MKGSIMIQGTASAVGKSMLCAALCRILKQDGYAVAPFKSQNMALNSAVTVDGGEMGRAQVMQAEAAGVEPQVDMNPVLLKPTSDQGSQVIVMGRPVGNMSATEYLDWRDSLAEEILAAYRRLAVRHDIVVIEGAGSPAEINLREKDLVNMGLATLIRTPVLLAGDIDRGGVFASLYGTVALLQPAERALLRGVIINKFRGNRKILEPGLQQLEELIGLRVLGVIPHLDLNLDDEDSLTGRFGRSSQKDGLQVKVVLLPRISNFTDFNPFEVYEDVDLSYIRSPAELGNPDLLILPGSKNTIADLQHLRQLGWDRVLKDYVAKGGLLFGICGGFQMLGRRITDPGGVESDCPEIEGFGLLDMETVMEEDKVTRLVQAAWQYRDDGYFSAMKQGELLKGYEIHMGRTTCRERHRPLRIEKEGRQDGAVGKEGRVVGAYLHGLFDNLEWTGKLLNNLRARRGLPPNRVSLPPTYGDFKSREYDRLAEAVRDHLDLKKVYCIIESGIKV